MKDMSIKLRKRYNSQNPTRKNEEERKALYSFQLIFLYNNKKKIRSSLGWSKQRIKLHEIQQTWKTSIKYGGKSHMYKLQERKGPKRRVHASSEGSNSNKKTTS